MRIIRRRKKRIAVDTETTGLSRWAGDRPFAVSMCDEDGREFYWEWDVDPRTRQPIPNPRHRRDVQLIVGDVGIAKDFFNAHFDVGMLETIGIQTRGEIHDVQWMARATTNLEHSFQLKPLAKKYVDVDDDDAHLLHDVVVKCRRIARRLKWSVGEDVEQDYWIPSALKRLHPELIGDLDVEACRKYAVQDAVRTILLSAFYRVAMREYGVEKVYEDERRLFPVTKQMIDVGIVVDEARLKTCETESRSRVAAAMKKLVTAYKGDFNVNSSKQVVELLFGGRPLRLPAMMRTKKNNPMTGGEALLPHIHNPLVEALITARANEKAISTFFGKYKALAVREDDGLILHPGFRQWGTETARYSCGDPNLQAVSNPETTSSRTAQFVVDVRQVFVPRPGYRWYCPDYSQVEVIIFADISQEPTLLEAIRNKVDIHEATTNKVWGGVGNPRTKQRVRDVLLAHAEDLDKAKKVLALKGRSVTLDFLVDALVEKFDWRIADLEKSLDKKIHRKLAKSVTFTKIFGGGPKALMSWINVQHSEAVTILRAYEESFPTMMQRMQDIERQGREQGYMIGPFGDRLCVDPWQSYQIVNHMVQNAAARLNKRGMIKCHEYLAETGLDARIGLTIHDELILEWRIEHAFKHVLRKVCELMSDHGGVFSVPTPVDIDRVDERWSKKVKVNLS